MFQAWKVKLYFKPVHWSIAGWECADESFIIEVDSLALASPYRMAKTATGKRRREGIMAENASYTQEYFDIIHHLDGDIDSRRTAYDYLQHSTAIFHGQVIEASFVPKLFNQRSYDVLKYTAQTMHRILCKVIQRYWDDPDYRQVFSYDERLVELLLLPRGYDAVLPFARIDVFLNEEDYRLHFCEFNGDGASGMNENREVTASITNSESFKVFGENHRLTGLDLFDPWVEEFMRIYDSYQYKVAEPRVAICDYLEQSIIDEFYLYKQCFEKHGIPCEIVDVRDLRFDGEQLLDGEGNPIHAIWRRCVTNDVINHWSESQDLINAVRAEKVALIGSFAGHIIHDKQIFSVLYRPETTAFLDAEEISLIEQTIPLTAFLNSDEVNMDQIREHKDSWIIKPSDHYGADQVFAGCSLSDVEWSEVIERYRDSRAGFPCIVQSYITPYRSLMLPPDTGIDTLPDGAVESDPVAYNNLNGLWLFNGHFQGVYSRLGPQAIICGAAGGFTAATFWVDCETDNGSNDFSQA